MNIQIYIPCPKCQRGIIDIVEKRNDATNNIYNTVPPFEIFCVVCGAEFKSATVTLLDGGHIAFGKVEE